MPAAAASWPLSVDTTLQDAGVKTPGGRGPIVASICPSPRNLSPRSSPPRKASEDPPWVKAEGWEALSSAPALPPAAQGEEANPVMLAGGPISQPPTLVEDDETLTTEGRHQQMQAEAVKDLAERALQRAATIQKLEQDKYSLENLRYRQEQQSKERDAEQEAARAAVGYFDPQEALRQKEAQLQEGRRQTTQPPPTTAEEEVVDWKHQEEQPPPATPAEEVVDWSIRHTIEKSDQFTLEKLKNRLTSSADGRVCHLCLEFRLRCRCEGGPRSVQDMVREVYRVEAERSAQGASSSQPAAQPPPAPMKAPPSRPAEASGTALPVPQGPPESKGPPTVKQPPQLPKAELPT